MSDERPTALMVHPFAGGLTLGVAEHFRVLAHLECAELNGFGVAFAERNLRLPVHVRPAETWATTAFAQHYRGRVSAVFGNPPCTVFSKMTVGMRQHGPESDVARHIWETFLVGHVVDAALTVVETVDTVLSKTNRPFVGMLRERVRKSGRFLRLVLTNYANHGTPQNRNRAFLIMTRYDVPVQPTPLHDLVTVADAISDLAGQPFGDGPYASGPRSDYQAELRGEAGRCTAHVALPFNSPELEAAVREIGPGQDMTIIPKERLPREWRKLTRAKAGYNMGFGKAPARLRWDAPSRVVTGITRLVHPDHNRFLTVREHARLMGIPDEWDFALRDGVLVDLTRAVALIGRGVPVHAGRWIAAQARHALEVAAPARGDSVVDLRRLRKGRWTDEALTD